MQKKIMKNGVGPDLTKKVNFE